MDNNNYVQIEPVGPRYSSAPADGVAERAIPNMDYYVFCRLADQLPERTDLRLQGRGEPLQHLHLFDMVRYAVERGILVSMTTGLTILSEQRAEECVHSGLHRIHIMIDAAASPLTASGPIPQRHLRVLRNLRRLMDARVKLQSSQPEMALIAILDYQDLPQLSTLVKFAHAEGIEDMTVEIADRAPSMPPMSPLTHAIHQRNAFNEAQKLAQMLGVTLHQLRFARDSGGGDPASRPSVSIGYDGEPCSFQVFPEYRTSADDADQAACRETPCAV